MSDVLWVAAITAGAAVLGGVATQAASLAREWLGDQRRDQAQNLLRTQEKSLDVLNRCLLVQDDYLKRLDTVTLRALHTPAASDRRELGYKSDLPHPLIAARAAYAVAVVFLSEPQRAAVWRFYGACGALDTALTALELDEVCIGECGAAFAKSFKEMELALAAAAPAGKVAATKKGTK